RRWPGMRFRTRVLHVPDAGRVRARDALRALQAEAARHGAEVRHETPVTHLAVRGDDEVAVTTATGTLTARRVVVTAGAWTQRLLGGLLPLPRLVVTEEQPAHFRPLAEDLAWPSFNHRPDPGAPEDAYWLAPVYGMLTPGEGVKAGFHRAGPVVDPDARSYAPEPGRAAALRRYARQWLPGVDPDAAEPVSCTYTSTDTEDFVLDRVGPLVVGAGFSGHGFKFTPAVGRVLADLVEGRPAPAPFRLAR
ncbi:FAD-dependent oxidoreductase, partial [Kineococcus glutinatus]|uniref:FAD-dependent oxidoreductase n=1 Tax=Kineococcus glutinatus TaxID=1070872 RepID=UPI0031E7EB12